ncbi:hypothetical protein D9611_013257 [Ephemerocybe angulata]|uniref:Ubiquinol-cytochrome c chaperone domain-containing protein n=1 Tax=Ephemerocybe angulata TaxID=980116 RepID=A0A8H5FJ58_9AGAR|nr:hypothetical protein D9611_013257 [Tulosesus angulatus]
MLPRAILLRRLKASSISPCIRSTLKRQTIAPLAVRYSNSGVPTSTPGPSKLNENLNSTPSSSSSSRSSDPEVKLEAEKENLEREQESWLTRKVEESPAAKSLLMAAAKVLGYGSPRQLAARRAFVLYEKVAAVRADEDMGFWLDGCYLPPTFQSWFTITNLHIWMLTVRLRALPAEHGTHYIQALIDHFFIDIEDRIRAVLQPKEPMPTPYTFTSTFYLNPNAQPTKEDEDSNVEKGLKEKMKKKRVLNRAPDRIVTRQMKIFKEQWAGLGLAFDLAMVQGDQEMAAAVWRNLLGARGAQGIEYPLPGSKEAKAATANANANARFRRAVNLVGGEVVNVEKLDLEKEERTDDESGVHDFPPSEVDKYLTYPVVMRDLTEYVRRELARLDRVRDEDIMEGDWAKLRFGQVLEKKEKRKEKV